jgi:hypothetical protein
MPLEGGEARLVDVNPVIHSWYVLDVKSSAARGTWHLQVVDPSDRLTLDPAFTDGVTLIRGDRSTPCALWSAPSALVAAAGTGKAWEPLCGGRVQLRSDVAGRKTALEFTTDFLRDNVAGGERITTLVKDAMPDRNLREGQVRTSGGAASAEGGPPRPLLDAARAGAALEPTGLGLPLSGVEAGAALEAGRWYGVDGVPDGFVSAVLPELVDPAIVSALGASINPLDSIERTALVWHVAFRLDAFDFDFELGTDHPRVGWSERLSRSTPVPGPDGFDTVAPFARTGRVPPYALADVVATFVGGFKRSHGAMRSGDLAKVNNNSHYGFVSNGAVLSTLQPGLATFVIDADGTVDLRTWSDADDAELWRVRHARQNGVPVLETTPDGTPRAGDLVRSWSQGNWSGSVEGNLRSLRAGACIIDNGDTPYLLYGWFSAATPSAMAVVWASFGCRYGMLLDMNALEHTYLSLHRFEADAWQVFHLDTGMAVLDKKAKDGITQPRFVSFSDNRDFFYVTRRRP